MKNPRGPDPMEQLYGLMAEFDNPDDLLKAAQRVHEKGYRKTDAYSPFPIDGLSDALGFGATRMPFIILVGGILGCLVGYSMQYWAMVVSTPLNVGGRPLNSWPAFVPITFELTILCAALAAVFGMLAANNLPMPYHPVFNVPRFALASRSQFFLCIEARDPLFKKDEIRQFLAELKPKDIYEVEA